MQAIKFPYLNELPNSDLVALLAQYVRTPPIDESDREFIAEIQRVLKYRKPETWKEVEKEDGG